MSGDYECAMVRTGLWRLGTQVFQITMNFISWNRQYHVCMLIKWASVGPSILRKVESGRKLQVCNVVHGTHIGCKMEPFIKEFYQDCVRNRRPHSYTSWRL